MYLIPAEDRVGVGRIGAALAASTFSLKPSASIVPATGNTPMATYAELAALARSGSFATENLRVFQLDEYLGVAPDDERSLYGWMQRSFLEPLAIPERNVVRLTAHGVDPQDACRDYVAAVGAAQGIDLAILGLGPNGHLGFNEPPSHPASVTRVVKLTRESLESNAGYWSVGATVPAEALTAGLDLLLAARQVLLLVSGAHKRHVLAQTLHGPITDLVPASHLRRRPNVFVVADRAALEP